MWFCTLLLFRAVEVIFFCEFSSVLELGLTRPMGRKARSKTRRSDKTLKRSQEMCDQNSLTPAGTIWKTRWEGQLWTHYARESLKACGQRNDLRVWGRPFHRGKLFFQLLPALHCSLFIGLQGKSNKCTAVFLVRILLTCRWSPWSSWAGAWIDTALTSQTMHWVLSR